MTYKCLNWLDNYNKALPVMVFDLEKLKKNYFIFKKKFLDIKPYYAVKANPNHKIINLLNCLGSYFDCASINEIKLCIRNNVNPRKISFGNTIKKEKDIREAYKLGIKIFAYDAKLELEKIAISNTLRSKVLSILIDYFNIHLQGFGKIKSVNILHEIFR